MVFRTRGPQHVLGTLSERPTAADYVDRIFVADDYNAGSFSDGTNWNGLFGGCPLRQNLGWINDFQDFVLVDDANGAPVENNVSVSNSGTGSTASWQTGYVNANTCGVATNSTGTTTTGRSAVFMGHAIGSHFEAGSGMLVYVGKVLHPNLASESAAAQAFTSRFGFMDSVSAESVDGVYFTHDSSTDNWRIKTRSNSVETSTLVNTTTAVSTTNYQELCIIINSAGSSVSFYINGSEVSGSPLTSNIPTGSSRVFSVAHFILKSAGTTSRDIKTDYIGYAKRRSTVNIPSALP